MDIISYLLGKNSSKGGGITPTGSISINENGTYDVTNYASADVNVPAGGNDWSLIGYSGEPEVIKEAYDYAKTIYDNWDATRTNMNEMYKSNNNLIYFPLVDTSHVDTFYQTFMSCYSLSYVPVLNTSIAVNLQQMFDNCHGLHTIPLIDTGNVTNFQQFCNNCYTLKNVPILDTSKATNMTNMFNNCSKFTDETLNNILKMCIDATSYNGTKTLYELGLRGTNYPASRLMTLSNYDNFRASGWTEGF